MAKRFYVAYTTHPDGTRERFEFLDRASAVRMRIDERNRMNARRDAARALARAKAETAKSAAEKAYEADMSPCPHCEGTGTKGGVNARRARNYREGVWRRSKNRRSREAFPKVDDACCVAWPVPCGCGPKRAPGGWCMTCREPRCSCPPKGDQNSGEA